MTGRRSESTSSHPVLDEATIRRRSTEAGEPAWLLAIRLDGARRVDPGALLASGIDPALLASRRRPTPAPTDPRSRSDDRPDGIDLGPDLIDRGVIVEPLDVAVRAHPDLVRPHLDTVASLDDDPVAAINAAAWDGGTFIHVPAGVELAIPIQATSRGRAASVGRFERTLLVAAAGSVVHYIEGCSAPIYSADSIRCAVTEVVVGPGARVTHAAIQNWSTNVTNLVAKGATVGSDGQMEWIDGNMGSQLTSTLPTTHLIGSRAEGIARSVTMVGAGQRHRGGARMLHTGPQTTSTVVARIIAEHGGACHHRGVLEIGAEAAGVKSRFSCDALVLDDNAEVEVDLDRRIGGPGATVEEETSSSDLDAERLFYLTSRGLSATQAGALLANGFIEPVTRRLPIEFAVEWNRLVELHFAGAVG